MSATQTLFQDSGANLSPCRLYRYSLFRQFGPGTRSLVFLMINPSTADEVKPDHTVKKCIGFARRHECDRIDVVNLFAWRSKDPPDLLKAPDPIGDPVNMATILDVSRPASFVLAAWGGPYSGALKKLVMKQAERVRAELALIGIELRCLGVTKDGWPRHPLMMPYASEIAPWRSP